MPRIVYCVCDIQASERGLAKGYVRVCCGSEDECFTIQLRHYMPYKVRDHAAPDVRHTWSRSLRSHDLLPSAVVPSHHVGHTPATMPHILIDPRQRHEAGFGRLGDDALTSRPSPSAIVGGPVTDAGSQIFHPKITILRKHNQENL